MTLPNRKLNRMNGYDYSRDALYFVTCCVHNMDCVFGSIAEDEMRLNKYGLIAEKQWAWLQEQYPYINSHAFVVMPNHMHAILEINQEDITAGIKVKSLSGLIGAYKTTSSKLIRQAGLAEFAWQRSFHDHIIRHERSYKHILNYILNNPTLWKEDVFYQPS